MKNSWLTMILGSSWKTGLAGYIGLILSLGTTVQAWLSGTPTNWSQVALSAVVSIGLLWAKYHNVTGGTEVSKEDKTGVKITK